MQNSKSKLKAKNADWIIANDVSKDIGFNKDYNAVTIIRSDGQIHKLKKIKKFYSSIISGEIIKKLLINDKSLN